MGSAEAGQAAEASFFSPSEPGQQEVLLDSFEPKLQAGILHRTNLNELHQLLRKFPAAPGLLFLLLTHRVEEKQARQPLSGILFSPSTDLPLIFRKLRI